MLLGLQTCLTNTSELEKIRVAAISAGMEAYDIPAIPFETKSSHHLRFGLTWPYGSTTLINNLYKEKEARYRVALHFDPNKFCYASYLRWWGKLMLNSEAIITQAKNLETPPGNWLEEDIFIRPEGDDKQFTGHVIKARDLPVFAEDIPVQSGEIHPNTLIVVGPAYKIDAEYRCFVVNDKVVTGSMYKNKGRLKPIKGLPQDIEQFANQAIQKWQPSYQFVLDIAVCNNKPYILEAGCIHSAGFYAADKYTIFKAINQQ